MLLGLGFGFEGDVDNRSVTLKVRCFKVTLRMHDDLIQDELIKQDKKTTTFVKIGEPDNAVVISDGGTGSSCLSELAVSTAKGQGQGQGRVHDEGRD